MWIVALILFIIVVPSSLAHKGTQKRQLDVYEGGVKTSDLEAWLEAKIDYNHAIENLTFGPKGWVIFASDAYQPKESSTDDKGIDGTDTRFKVGDKDEVFDWISASLRLTKSSFTSIAYGDGKWVAWSDPNRINAGELHGGFSHLDDFVAWVNENIEQECFPTSFAYGEGTYYAICNPRLGPLNGATEPDAPVESSFTVLDTADDAFNHMDTMGESGFSAVAMVAAEGKWIIYMEKKTVKDAWVLIRNAESSDSVLEWIAQYADGPTAYDLQAISFSFAEGAWAGWMSSVDTEQVTRARLCSAGCPQSWVGDGVCDGACKNAACWDDGGDCGVISPDAPYYSNITATGEEYCAPSCPLRNVGDDQCDADCMVAACGMDGGDCECAPGCRYTTMVDDGTCQAACNVEACAFDGQDCGRVEEPPEWVREAQAQGYAAGALPFVKAESSGLSDALLDTDPELLRATVAAWEAAAAQWNKVLLSSFAPIAFPGGDEAARTLRCRSTSVSFSPDQPLGGSVLVLAYPSVVDGLGGVRARAAPCLFDRETLMPRVGAVEIDMEDLRDMVERDILTRILMHEIGHVLGVGSLWVRNGLLDRAGTLDPRYNGQHGRAGLLRLGAKGRPAVANVGGRGTYQVHWREGVFGSELMTGRLGSGVQPLSALTLYAMRDLGYHVDFSQAEEFSFSKTPNKLREAAGTYGDDLAPVSSDNIRVIDADGVVYVRRADGSEQREQEGVFPTTSVVFLVVGVVLVAALLVEGYIKHKRIQKGEIEAAKPATALSSVSTEAVPTGPRWI